MPALISLQLVASSLLREMTGESMFFGYPHKLEWVNSHMVLERMPQGQGDWVLSSDILDLPSLPPGFPLAPRDRVSI